MKKFTIKVVCLITLLIFLALYFALVRYEKSIKIWYADLIIGIPSQNPQYAGTLEIPSLNITLPCIDSSDSGKSKIITDANGCAARNRYRLSNVNGINQEAWIISDHDYQGFDKIQGCKIGDLVQFRGLQGESLEYTVSDAFEGYIDYAGIPVNAKGEQFIVSAPRHMFLMTCYEAATVDAEPQDRRFFVSLELQEG